MSDSPQPLGVSISIDTPTLKIERPQAHAPEEEAVEAVQKPRRKRRTKAEMEADRLAEAKLEMPVEAAQEEFSPSTAMIRVKPKHGRSLYCHTQQKMIYAGFETLVLRDKWIANQIKKGILILV